MKSPTTSDRSAVSGTGIDSTTALVAPAPTAASWYQPRTTAAARWRRVFPAALCAAAIGATMSIPAIASAEPRELDVGKYDDCVAQVAADQRNGILHWGAEVSAALGVCCSQAGGTYNHDTEDCEAPPYDPAEVRPGVLPPGGLPNVTAVPATPTPKPVAPTLSQAPIGG